MSLIPASGIVLLEKLIISGSRYAFVFYALNSLDQVIGNQFFLLTSATVLLFTISHLGTDNLIISRNIVGQNNNIIFIIRLLSTFFAGILFLNFFYDKIAQIAVVATLIALIGMAIPISQLNSISKPKSLTLLRDRLMPEVIFGITRVYIILEGISDISILILAFFSSEIFYGLSNLLRIVKIRKIRISFIGEQNSIKVFKKILVCFSGVICLFCIQRGDILFISATSDTINQDAKLLIKSQQFFDMAGLIAYAMIPVINNYIKTKVSPILIINIVAVSVSFSLFFVMKIFSYYLWGYNLVNNLIEGLNIYFTVGIFYLGILTYSFMTYSSLNHEHNKVTQKLFVCICIKLLLFLILYKNGNPLQYSFMSSLIMTLIFIPKKFIYFKH